MKKTIHFFTVIELMSVMVVIVILTAIAVPVIIGASAKGKETTARADMNSIKLAMTQFKADYSVWPISGSADVFYSAAFYPNETGKDDAHIDLMMQQLTMVAIKPGTNDVPEEYTSTSNTNTKKRKYLDVPARPVTPIQANGTVTSGFFKIDPWGRRYNIAIDGSYDKKLELPAPFTRGSVETIAGDIAIFSYGTAEGPDVDNKTAPFDTDAFLYSWKVIK